MTGAEVEFARFLIEQGIAYAARLKALRESNPEAVAAAEKHHAEALARAEAESAKG